MRVKKLPKILALHLKRFKYMEQLQRYTKLSYRVVFPFELRLFNTVSADWKQVNTIYNWSFAVCWGPALQYVVNTSDFRLDSWKIGRVGGSRLGWPLYCCVLSLDKKLCSTLSLFMLQKLSCLHVSHLRSKCNLIPTYLLQFYSACIGLYFTKQSWSKMLKLGSWHLFTIKFWYLYAGSSPVMV